MHNVNIIVEYFINTLTAAWYLAAVVAPYLLLGFVIDGILHVIFPSGVSFKRFAYPGLKNVIRAAVHGLMRPESSGRSVGAAIDLRRGGASKGASISFLISSAQSGPDGFLAAWSMISFPFAFIRIVISFVTAIFAGLLVTTSPDEQEHKSHHRRRMFHGGEIAEVSSSPSFLKILHKTLFYGFIRMPRYVGLWLLIGLLLGSVIMVFVPFQGDSVLSNLLALILIPVVHVCATGSVPIAAALLMKGITPGAVLVFLMLGTAINLRGLNLLRGAFGWRILLIYLGSIFTCSIFSGFLTDTKLPRGLFLPHLPDFHSGIMASVAPWCTPCILVIAVLAVVGYVMHWLHLRRYAGKHSEDQSSQYVPGKEYYVSQRDASGVLQTRRAVSVTMLFSVDDLPSQDAASVLGSSIRHMEGIEDCEVSFRRRQALVRGVNLSPDYIVEAVAEAGFTAKFIREINPDELKK